MITGVGQYFHLCTAKPFLSYKTKKSKVCFWNITDFVPMAKMEVFYSSDDISG